MIDLTTLADNFSGIERYALNMSLNLIKHSEHEFVLIFKEKIFSAFENVHNENVSFCVLKRCNKLFFNLFRLPRALKKIKADVYLFLAFPVPLFFKRKKIVSAIHDLCCLDYPETMTFKSRWYFRKCFKSSIKKADKIITVSEFSKSRIVDRLKCSPDKVEVCYSALSEQFFEYEKKGEGECNSKYNLPPEYILTLSTIEPRKNIGLLLKAYGSIVAQDNNICDLVLAGRRGWKEKDLLDGISEQVKQKIHFTGFIDDVDLPAIYAGANVFVFPSKYEGFGLPPLEAMACGTLTLSSNTASMPEILGDRAFYFITEDEQDLKEQLNKVLFLPAEKKKKAETAGANYALKFQWLNSSEKLLKVLESLN